MKGKEMSPVEAYMARSDLPEPLKAANREYSGADDWVVALEADDKSKAKAKAAADELQTWQTFAQAPWEPPAGLLDAVTKMERDCPAALFLSRAVDLMAYGEGAAPIDPTVGVLETGARRRQAFSALCRAAGQNKFPLEHAADCDPIKPQRFNFVQGLGKEADSLEFNDEKEGDPDKHLKSVQIVDAAKFYAWIREQCGEPPAAKKDHGAQIPKGARAIPVQPFSSTKIECVRLALRETPPFNEGYVAQGWTWEAIATHIQEPYKRRMKERYQTENAPPSVATVRRVFGEGT
jgi:hypothetical protein